MKRCTKNVRIRGLIHGAILMAEHPVETDPRYTACGDFLKSRPDVAWRDYGDIKLRARATTRPVSCLRCLDFLARHEAT